MSDYTKFVNKFKALLVKLGVGGDWDVRYNFVKPSPTNDNVIACVQSDVAGRVAYVTYFGLGESQCTPERAAAHEFVHLLLAELRTLAESRYATQEQISLAEEKVAIVLEKVL